jgi:hypothetical protein
LKTFKNILIILILLLVCSLQIIIAQDTIPSVNARPLKARFQAEPMKATMMAVVLPGLGQIYNRKYWKIPLVYAGFGGLFFSAGFNSTKYNQYMEAFQDFTDGVPKTKSYLDIIPSSVDSDTRDPVLNYSPAEEAHWKERLIQGIDYYKRYRDLSYIGIAGWYLISILDANVDASLFNFDISNNLDIAVYPVSVPLPGGFTGAGVNVGMTVVF